MDTEAGATRGAPSDWRLADGFAQGIAGTKRALTSGVVAPVVVAAYVILAPVMGSLVGFELFNGQRVLQLLVLGVATASLCFGEARSRWVQSYCSLPGLARIGLGALFVLGCVSAAFAPLPRFAFLEVALFTLLFVVMIALVSQFQRNIERANTLVLLVLVAGASLYVLSFAIGYFFSLSHGLPVWPHAFNGFAHVRFFNQYQVWVLPLLVLPAVLLPIQSLGIRYSLHTLAALWYALLYASGGRGAVLALAASLVLMLVFYRKRALPWVRLQLVAAVGGLVLYVLLFVVLADNLSVFARLQEGGDSGRFELWSMALDMVGRHPMLGEGPMQFARYLNGYASHPHNAALQWASEWGVPSAIALLSLVAWGFVAWVRRCQREMRETGRDDRDLLSVALTAALTAAAIYSLVDGVTVMPLSQLLLVATIGWALATYRGRPSVARPQRTRIGPSLWLLVVVIAAWGSVGYGVFPEVTSLEALQDDHIQRTRPEILHPRFWQQGFIEP